MNDVFTPNLDKLRNIVQRFGSHSFTAAQVATEYEGRPSSSESTKFFGELLTRHAAVLGVQAVAGNPDVWQAA